MAPHASAPDATMTKSGDRELVIQQVFDAPRALVWEAMTRPEHVREWYGKRSMTTIVVDIDLRPGGAWRCVQTTPSGDEYAFSGVYREIDPPNRLVFTEGFEMMPDHGYVVTATFDEADGKTTLTSRLEYRSQQDRDGGAGSWSVWGGSAWAPESLARLVELVATLSPRSYSGNSSGWKA